MLIGLDTAVCYNWFSMFVFTKVYNHWWEYKPSSGVGGAWCSSVKSSWRLGYTIWYVDSSLEGKVPQLSLCFTTYWRSAGFL